MYRVIFLIKPYITNIICDITMKRMMQLWGEEERKYLGVDSDVRSVDIPTDKRKILWDKTIFPQVVKFT
jgi:hypothetical protein